MREKARLEAEHQKMLAEAAQRKADLEARLYVLQRESSATAASAEAAVYKAAAEIETEPHEDLAQVALECTNKYVQAHSLASNTQQHNPVVQQPPVTPHHVEFKANHVIPPAKTETLLCKLNITDEAIDETQRRHYSYQPPPPMSHAASFHDYSREAPVMTDLAKYLVRREMVSSGLLKFDDHPENYWA